VKFNYYRPSMNRQSSVSDYTKHNLWQTGPMPLAVVLCSYCR